MMEASNWRSLLRSPSAAADIRRLGTGAKRGKAGSTSEEEGPVFRCVVSVVSQGVTVSADGSGVVSEWASLIVTVVKRKEGGRWGKLSLGPSPHPIYDTSSRRILRTTHAAESKQRKVKRDHTTGVEVNVRDVVIVDEQWRKSRAME